MIHETDIDVAKCDEQLSRNVMQAMLIAAHTGMLRGVEVEACNGSVVLSGRTCSYYLKQLAQQNALNVDGVQQVSNHIRVHGPQERAESTGAQRTPR